MKLSSLLLAGLLLAVPALAGGGRQAPLPPALATQIIADLYPSGLPGRISQPVRKWEHRVLDLKGDGTPGYIIEVADPDDCGSGGCGMLIYVAKGAGFTSLYTGGNFYTATRCLKTRSNGYFDLFQRYRANSGKVYFHTLRFDGRQYRE